MKPHFLLFLLLLSCEKNAVAQPESAAPFSKEANFMSLTGFLRYQNYTKTGTWKPVIADGVGNCSFDCSTRIVGKTLFLEMGDFGVQDTRRWAEKILAQCVQKYLWPDEYQITWSNSFFSEESNGPDSHRFVYNKAKGVLRFDAGSGWQKVTWFTNWQKNVAVSEFFNENKK